MRRTIFAGVVALTSAICMAQTPDQVADLARQLEGTIYVTPHRDSVEGALRSCGMEFAALKRDFITKGGAPVKISGSFYFRRDQKNGIFYALKLGVIDGLAANVNAVAPSNAFIRAPLGTAPVKAKRHVADNPGFATFVGLVDEEVMAAFEAIAKQSQLVVGFNRAPGQTDVTYTLDLTVVDTAMEGGKVVRKNSDETVNDFVSCTGSLIRDIKK